MSPLAIEMADDGFTEGMQTLTYELHFFSMYARAPAASTLPPTPSHPLAVTRGMPRELVCRYAPGLLTSRTVEKCGARTAALVGAPGCHAPCSVGECASLPPLAAL